MRSQSYDKRLQAMVGKESDPELRARFACSMGRYESLVEAVLASILEWLRTKRFRYDPSDADLRDDLRSEVMLALTKRLQAGETIDMSSKFVATIAARRAMDFIRKHRGTDGERLMAELDDESPALPALENGDPAESAMETERSEQLHRAISRLPAKYREVVDRVALKGQAAGLVAKELKLSCENVRKILSRALAKLRDLLDGESLGFDCV